MAKDRFYFWRGYYDAMQHLTDEEAGRLFMAICSYAFDGEEPDFGGDRLMQVAWSMVADQARESVEIGRLRSEQGAKGGRPPKRGKKSSAKSSAKSTPLSSAESSAETTAESVRYGNVPSPPTAERGDASRSAPDGAALAPPGFDVPPRPEGD